MTVFTKFLINYKNNRSNPKPTVLYTSGTQPLWKKINKTFLGGIREGLLLISSNVSENTTYGIWKQIIIKNVWSKIAFLCIAFTWLLPIRNHHTSPLNKIKLSKALKKKNKDKQLALWLKSPSLGFSINTSPDCSFQSNPVHHFQDETGSRGTANR